MIKLGYSNRELSRLLLTFNIELARKAIYYFSTTPLPKNMIQKQMFCDRYVGVFKINDVLYSSERQCVSFFIACLLDDKLEFDIDLEYMNNLPKRCVRRMVYEAETPCSSSLALQSRRKMDVFEKALCDKWMLFFHLLACRYKFCTLNSDKAYNALMTTGDKYLCYAHMNDNVYGINMSPQEASLKISDPIQWTGQNIHGRILMTIRDEFKNIPIKRIGKDMDNPMKVIIRCEYPGLLKAHITMIEYLLGMESGTISLEPINKENVSYLYDVIAYIPRNKYANGIVKQIEEMLQEYPELEVI